MTVKWRCSACGHIHEGTETPDFCPNCGPGSTRFMPLKRGIPRFCKDFYNTFVLHAAAAHFNNGLLPAAVFFLLLTLFTGNMHFEHTALHMLVLALCIMPVSFFSGIRDWRKNFGGGRAPIFYRKMWLTGFLFLLGAGAAIIRSAWPAVLFLEGIRKWLYLGCLFGTLPVVLMLGHYGGKLAYQGKMKR